MINCERFVSLITDYLDDNLDRQQKSEFENHLQTCKECASVFERINSLQRHLRMLPSVKTSPVFDVVLKNRLRRELVAKNRTWDLFGNPWAKVSLAGLSAVAICLIAFFTLYYPSLPQKQQQAPPSMVSNSQAFGVNVSSSDSAQLRVQEKIYFVIEDVPANIFMSEQQHSDLLFPTNTNRDSSILYLDQFKHQSYAKSLVTVTF